MHYRVTEDINVTEIVYFHLTGPDYGLRNSGGACLATY